MSDTVAACKLSSDAANIGQQSEGVKSVQSVRLCVLHMDSTSHRLHVVLLALSLSSMVTPTCRRQIQLQSLGKLGARQALRMVVERDGPKGLYRGFLPNALKNLPNKGT